jgi:hypothetical protein
MISDCVNLKYPFVFLCVEKVMYRMCQLFAFRLFLISSDVENLKPDQK